MLGQCLPSEHIESLGWQISGSRQLLPSTPPGQTCSEGAQTIGQTVGHALPSVPSLIGTHVPIIIQLFSSTPPGHNASLKAQTGGQNDGHAVPSIPGFPSMGMQVSGSWQLFASTPPVQSISSVGSQTVGHTVAHGLPSIPGGPSIAKHTPCS